MAELAGLLLSVGVLAIVLGRWWLEARRHHRRLARLSVRIHVNGIRGKSTVTRIIAGLLREAGIRTIGKCTGSAAAVIDPHGRDQPIRRRAAATVLEQLDVVRTHVSPDVQALVVECMAIRPGYQDVSERLLVRSTIGVITNVREDHQDVMGDTLAEIAQALLSTCPRGGLLITAEQDSALQAILRAGVARHGARLLVADPAWVTDAEIEGFEYVAFKENVAIGLAVAEVLGIPRAVAVAGMQRAAPDPGVLRVRHFQLAGKRVTWANLFAVNDRESTILGMEKLARFRTPQTTMVGILNNRADREKRALQFADVAARDLQFDRLVTFGAYENVVTERLVANGFPRRCIIQLGEQHDPTLNEIVQQAIADMPGPHVLLVGLVNIHTKQADLLLHGFEHAARGQGVPDSREGAN